MAPSLPNCRRIDYGNRLPEALHTLLYRQMQAGAKAGLHRLTHKLWLPAISALQKIFCKCTYPVTGLGD